MRKLIPGRARALMLIVLAIAVSATAAAAAPITPAQLAARADAICKSDADRQAALGSGLVNADDVSKAHLPRAAAYLDKIIAITTTEVHDMAALPKATRGTPQLHALGAAIRTVLKDEQAAAGAAHNGKLLRFRKAFDRFIVHGHPTGPDYRKAIAAGRAARKIFPFKVCGKTNTVYP